MHPGVIGLTEWERVNMSVLLPRLAAFTKLCQPFPADCIPKFCEGTVDIFTPKWIVILCICLYINQLVNFDKLSIEQINLSIVLILIQLGSGKTVRYGGLLSSDLTFWLIGKRIERRTWGLNGVCAIVLRLYTSTEHLKRVYTSPELFMEMFYFT
jgi:hypothetical protein